MNGIHSIFTSYTYSHCHSFCCGVQGTEKATEGENGARPPQIWISREASMEEEEGEEEKKQDDVK